MTLMIVRSGDLAYFVDRRDQIAIRREQLSANVVQMDVR